MNAFIEHHQDSIRFGYRCFDPLTAKWIDPAIPATRTSDRVFQYLPEQPACYTQSADRHSRSVQELGD